MDPSGQSDSSHAPVATGPPQQVLLRKVAPRKRKRTARPFGLGSGISTTVKVMTILGLAVAAFLSAGLLIGTLTLHGLFTENTRLKAAISTLTHEDQIGFAKVIHQFQRDGKLFTTLKFVETDLDDRLQRVLEKEYTVEGSMIHFDALIVKFDQQMVIDGKERALYMWRRVYGDKQTPEHGFPIEEDGKEPQRYAKLLSKLSIPERDMFWTAVWDLANDPMKLRDYGITAIYGNVVYSSLRRDLIYVFKISPGGQLSIEVVPDM